ncbi:MAG TPA: FUSC family protein [Stellaceae bacterium]|nr:FUSC family protein [Stellaceae bacterium]
MTSRWIEGAGPLGAWLRQHGAELRLSLRMTAAALAAFALAQLFHLAQGYWAVLTAVIVIQSSIGGSLKASVDRFIATLGGAVFGAVVALLLPPHNPVILGLALLVGMAPLALLSALNASFRMAPITAIIVLLGGSTQTAGPVAAALARVTEIGIGCAVGFAVAMLVLPAPAHHLASGIAGRALGHLEELLQALIAGLTTEPDAARIAALHQRMRAACALLEASAKEAERERRIHLVSGPDAEPLGRTVRRLHMDLVIFGRAATRPIPEPMRTRLAPRLQQVSDTIGEFLRGTGAALAARRPPPDFDAVAAALDGYGAAMTELRRERLTRDLSDEEAGRIFALGFGLEQLRRDLDDLRSRAAEFALPAPRRLASAPANAG